ncbi:hypothetical protein VNO80_06569 [Phaseolus coccineus]|uniref:Pentatricopeptide repeat-containing protein n=1 Tax=Phaseolus coccineus TaxID=3886 RepID=A0AAN9NHR5_PHACN
MVKVYGILPSVDHFSCLVDFLGRSGCLDELETVIKNGYLGAHSNMCWSMFSACAAHANLKLGRTVVRILLERDNDNPSIHVLLSNICAAAGVGVPISSLSDQMDILHRFQFLNKLGHRIWVDEQWKLLRDFGLLCGILAVHHLSSSVYVFQATIKGQRQSRSSDKLGMDPAFLASHSERSDNGIH